jgi:hypothetical protein
MTPSFLRHPELVSGSILETVQPMTKWMLKQVQHDGRRDA